MEKTELIQGVTIERHSMSLNFFPQVLPTYGRSAISPLSIFGRHGTPSRFGVRA